jgi:hypothetical protein
MGRLPGLDPLVTSRDSTPGKWGFGHLLRVLEQRTDPFEQLGRDLPASALGAQDALQLALELGMAAARVTATQVPLDLDAQSADELSIEVELDLLQHVLTVSR